MERHAPFSSVSSAGTMPAFAVLKRDGSSEQFDEHKVWYTFTRAARGLEHSVSPALMFEELRRTIFEGILTTDLEKAQIMAAGTFIERDPAYGIVAARLLRQKLAREVIGRSITENDYPSAYKEAFMLGIHRSVSLGLLDSRMADFDLGMLAQEIVIERDELVTYMGMHTLYERYLLKHHNSRIELLQSFWMRIAMGLALNETSKNERALEFYHAISTLRYVPSTPTLFHAGFPVAQLSSCYLNTVSDDLHHIFKVFSDDAQLSKWAGGIGTDWTNVRGTGSFIKSIRSSSQGVIPYLKIANDIVVCITRSGIRRGGMCVYLESWHLDIEEFLDLRRNTGDERRRTHDMNTSNWIPDLFMKRVIADGTWTLFSPSDTPDLHELYGTAFEKRYEEYEAAARAGTILNHRVTQARQLWRKMLTRLFETGHPWITFKDPCNIRSPQDHVGVVHSSNLCTEITLNTSEKETAVCNLGSINLEKHIINGVLDEQLLESTIRHAVRMLDNVVDLNFYPTEEAAHSNRRHRPVGLGVMGFQDALFTLNIPFSSPTAKEFADTSMETISYHAISASCDLAAERGPYETFAGSKWDRGIFPLDTLELLEKERGRKVTVNRTARKNWTELKARVKKQGMRNSNTMAIAPTATISTIADCYPCIEPIYKNIYVKSNVSGEFTIVNRYLVDDLKKLGLWSETMLNDLKFNDGDLEKIAAIPAHLREKYKTAFELDASWMIEITAARGKWIDQSQSHNVFMKGVSGQKLDEIYRAAWECGLKTTYYLRTLGASQIEKSTLDAGTYGFTQKRNLVSAAEEVPVAVAQDSVQDSTTSAPSSIVEVLSEPVRTAFRSAACSLQPESCESCQ